MTKVDPWYWVDLWCNLWDEDYEHTNWIEIYLMQELNYILECNPYPSDWDSDSDSDEDERDYPVINPYEMNPHGGQNWEIDPEEGLRKD